ncbi:undecaprenyldiphospho-muramoylpentapeptide beta-N-acetylglucosaminyltransferase [Desulfolucanica intricata]|uniref:undecaprenyldiphospho-muramoylpentapeptide beta-N-acetylglucosaminyltransferase n=1 Tax=Desulfolucanica intricata TaxID=1285191 RepID=UPI00082D7D5A|nr:undecaprenyldiphospho-muramoylpentapeptide beta-N-acetylglucosaminyltransferase [Desulfolucanica intricata]
MRAIITGGGTGGHIYPALAIARGIKERYPGAEILYIGTARGLESDLVPKAGFPFATIPATGLKRKLSVQNLTVAWQAIKGLLEARRLIRRFTPDVVIGTGGYVCGPVVLAAALQRIPTMIHEQNAFPGITNRILSRFTRKVAVTFEDSVKHFSGRAEVELTGLPIRPEILTADRKKARAELGLAPDNFLILSFGGSQGARSINRAIVGVMEVYYNNPKVHILHVTGPNGYKDFVESAKSIPLDDNGNITITRYLYNMPDALAAADLVICRAGAATLAELTARGVPSILIPYPYASENHQEYNARALVEQGAAYMILDHDLNGSYLSEKVKALLTNPQKLESMAKASKNLGRPHALRDILKSIEKITK